MAYLTVLSIVVALGLTWTLGSIFDDEQDEAKETGDGSLRCYQCNSSLAKNPSESTCFLGNWRYANNSEKRNMIMQCPRSRSYFCHLILGLKNKSTVRGCSGLDYTNGKRAYIGCFFMGDDYRVCLCDTNLCNGAERVNGFSAIVWYVVGVGLVGISLCNLGFNYS